MQRKPLNQGQQFLSEVQQAVEDSYRQAGRPKGMPPLNEVRTEITRMGLEPQDAEAIYDSWLQNGFRTRNGPIKSWQAAIRNWQRYGYFPSQKQKPAKARIDIRQEQMLNTMKRMQARDSRPRPPSP